MDRTLFFIGDCLQKEKTKPKVNGVLYDIIRCSETPENE